MPLRLVSIGPSSRKGKKHVAVFVEETTEGPKELKVHFGAEGMEDYIIHKDDERKRLYLARTKHQDVSYAASPATLSRFILWNKPTMKESVEDYKKKFGV